MQGWPPTTKPRPRPPARGRLAAARANPQGRPTARTRGGDHPQGHQPTRAVANRGDSCEQKRHPRAQLLAAQRLQGAVLAGRSVARRHSYLQRGTRKGLPPAGAAAPATRVAAPWQDGYRWAKAAAAYAGAAATTHRGQEG
ncbi:hypothetical protein B296_00014649 [Ensete ventricosum]|uniref:Uncharacterized protein n=1 Tax=Ensete ventricosum TaxID=4639 RepID=A0A426XGM6_ENSVE|nr:hypothetical protein B296_00014649 [Ensete ventricosum]